MKRLAAAPLSLAILTAASLVASEALAQEGSQGSQEVPDWVHVEIEDVRAERGAHGRPWQEFLRVPDLFAGLYEIPSGGEDTQSPHGADEVYYVLEGQATAVVDDDRIPVRPGSVLYVAKEVEHRFVDITEDLSVLVFFATAESDGG
ncbi:MAG: cupin domain-containing protein [Longimicrobiales bacterium]|nr:cupin domain-containing protein [Longimicrobiales bacterium]